MSTLDKRDLWRRANMALDEGKAEQALEYLWRLLDRSHLTEDEVQGNLRLLARALATLGRRRALATVHLYQGDLAGVRRVSDHPLDLARERIASGDAGGAAKAYLDHGWLGHAAIQLERAGDDRGARVLWERLADDARLSQDLYVQGLVRFNLGRACERLGDDQAARRAIVSSMQLVEAAADGFETQGLRERAFDCYQVLLALGKDGAFENLAEGYLNCIRILQEDNLRYYVLQYYEDFQNLALQRGELHAAATLFREAATFCRRYQLPYERYYRVRAAETQVRSAQRMLSEGGPAEMAENAYAAAIDAYNDLGSYSNVRDVYGALAQLELGAKRRARYLRLRMRLASVEDEEGPVVSMPDYLRMDTAYPEIWRLDVLEWEQGGDPAETMGEVFLDEQNPAFIRRRALLCRLRQLGAPEYEDGASLAEETLIALAEQLGRVEIYVAIAPLEHLVEHTSPRVRAAVLKACSQLYFKRTLGLVEKGLRDEEDMVRRRALEAVETLHFGHAFDPLQRIYRGFNDPEIRFAALRSIGKIPSLEAAEMLVDVLRQGDADKRALVRELLAKHDQPELDDILQRAMQNETGAVRVEFERVLRSRGF